MANRIEINNDLRPAYYDDFRCLAAGCRYSCCKGWRISFNKKDYLSLKRQEGSEEFNARMDHGLRRIRKGPLTDIHFGEFDMDGGVCPLLREDCLCDLQVEKGHGALPEVCRVFPRSKAYMASGYLERSLSPACEGVLELLWELPEGIEFRSDPLPKADQKFLTFHEGQSLAVFFPHIREWCVDVLQDRRCPLAKRILMMGIALRELADGEEDVAAWLLRARALAERGAEGLPEAEGAAALPLMLSNHFRTLLQLQTAGTEFASVPGDVSRGLDVKGEAGTSRVTISLERYQAARARYEENFRDREYFMENLMVSLFFHLRLPVLSSAEELWKGYVNFCNLYSFYHFMAVMSCREGAAGDKAELYRMMVCASRGLIHNGARQSSLRDEFFANDSATLAHMAILLGG
ncbi:MAG: flagellin lysine-N-methylase [Oscillospiraceae bacterium]|nr:flagellin lysine-N-methylase [Oscillospiraceae bacterium]